MAICHICISAVQKLRPHDRAVPPGNRVSATLPKISRAAVLDCWICCKFSRWLEAEESNVFETWRREPLPVEFVVFGRFYPEEPHKENALLPLFINISPLTHDSVDDVCEIELNFLAKQGRTISFASKKSFNADSWRFS